ncbi:MAG: FecR domain-containing protein [Bacteroidota bacterium]|nr:FecR domain-containing protein [Bacteroidota bacterium]
MEVYMEDHARLFYLWQLYVDGRASREELLLLRTLLDIQENEKASRDWLVGQLEQTVTETGFSEQRLQAVLRSVRESGQTKETVRQMHFIKRYWWVAAALVCLMVPGYLMFFNKGHAAGPLTKTFQHFRNDLDPGRNRAFLTLANGAKVILDSVHNGMFARQGNATIVKLDSGKLAYDATGQESAVVGFNTLTTPKGGQYQLSLPDGTEVWLNAASSIKYPTAFMGNRRQVEITGEVYFEVSKNTAMPFIVKKLNDETEIRVLGTHFDVNAYDDEPSMKITLLEGAVQVADAGRQSILHPGQQAQIGNGTLKLLSDVDTDEVMAWKNGKFQFGEASDINSIMRQIARWYDVEVEYRGTVSDHIGGTISRGVKASQVFDMLEMTGAVRFSIDGKKVTVMP